MLGKTHMAVGAATALALLQPNTVSGCVCAVAGGVIGGWICDIDVRSHSTRRSDNDGEDEEELEAHGRERWQIFVFMLMTAAICFGIDYFAGNGMCAYITSHLGIPMLLAGAIIVGVCAYGITSAHRTVMHSLLGGTVLSGALFVLCAPIAPAFSLGYASHILLDLFNRRRIQLFWPIKKGLMLGLCGHNGAANKIIGALGLIACLILFPMFFVPSLGANDSFNDLFRNGGNSSSLFQSSSLSNFQLYLVAINVVTFLIYMIDYLAWNRGAYDDNPKTDRQDFVHTVFLLLPAAGGAIGMLLAVIIGTGGQLVRGENGTIGFYTHGLCFLVVWVSIYFITCNPFGISLETSSVAKHFNDHHIIPIVFATLNMITFFVFLFDNKQYRKMNLKEIAEFILVFIGGATGAYLAMVLTNHKMGTVQFGQAVPLMMAMHYILFAIGYFNGLL